MAAQSSGRTHTKILGASDYDEAAYWDEKFANKKDIGEWLNSGDAIIDVALSSLDGRQFDQSTGHPRVLHLGPGISKLGSRLRDAFVQRGLQGKSIVNVDFSAEAVRLGRDLETGLDPTRAMHWVQADLRSWADVSEISCFAPVDMILDKSTSDAIATSTPVAFSSSSDASDTCEEIQRLVKKGGEITLLPVEVLALHLAPLARPGAIWIALSFSATRFENLPHAMAHWAVVAQKALKAPHGHSSPSVHTPEVFHWLYILKRK